MQTKNSNRKLLSVYMWHIPASGFYTNPWCLAPTWILTARGQSTWPVDQDVCHILFENRGMEVISAPIS